MRVYTVNNFTSELSKNMTNKSQFSDMSEEHILVVAPAGHKVQVLTGGL
jgi:hypothetical protein